MSRTFCTTGQISSIHGTGELFKGFESFLVWPLPWDQLVIRDPTRGYCPKQHSPMDHGGTQIVQLGKESFSSFIYFKPKVQTTCKSCVIKAVFRGSEQKGGFLILSAADRAAQWELSLKRCWKMCKGCFPSVCLSDNPRQNSNVCVYIRVIDINDNAPVFASVYKTFVCEKTRAGQVPDTYTLCYTMYTILPD